MTRWVPVTAAMVVAALAATAGASAVNSSGSSGVRGVVTVSHGCPGPVRFEHPQRCGHPGAGVVVQVFRTNGSTPIRSARTDSQGRFSFSLPAAGYVLRVELKQAKPKAFTVGATSWTELSLFFLVPPFME